MEIPVLFLLERMGVEVAVPAALGGALVSSVRLLNSVDDEASAPQLAEPDQGAPESHRLGRKVLYIGRAEDAIGREVPAGSFLLASVSPLSPQGIPAVGSSASGMVFASFDVLGVFERAVDICFRYQERLERFRALLHEEGNADALMRECSALFGNAAYMVDSSFKVIGIDDSPLFVEISYIWKHLVDERFLLYDIVYGMQRSHQLETLLAQSGATLCESEPDARSDYFNNPFINYNLMRGKEPREAEAVNLSCEGEVLGHFFVVGYQKQITPGELVLAGLIGGELARFVERFGLSSPEAAPHEAFIRRLMEDSPVNDDDIVRQMALWGWRADDELCIIAVGEQVRGTLLGDIVAEQLDHELDAKSIRAEGVVMGIARMGDDGGSERRAFADALERFLAKRSCVAGISDAFAAARCTGRFFRQARMALEIRQSVGEIVQAEWPHADATPKPSGTCPMLSFGECFSRNLVGALAGGCELGDFADDRIRTLAEVDAHSNTNYLHTLDVYLRCERRLNESANRLFVHRNTLLYRIARIKRILDDDLENSEVRLRLIFSIEVLRAERDAHGD